MTYSGASSRPIRRFFAKSRYSFLDSSAFAVARAVAAGPLTRRVIFNQGKAMRKMLTLSMCLALGSVLGLFICACNKEIALQKTAHSRLASDEALTKNMIGRWLCDDPTGKSEYTYYADGTWAEEGVYYFEDGHKDVTLGGQWKIKDGYYYQTLTASSIPDRVRPYDWIRFAIVNIDHDECVTILPNGELHRHVRIEE